MWTVVGEMTFYIFKVFYMEVKIELVFDVKRLDGKLFSSVVT